MHHAASSWVGDHPKPATLSPAWPNANFRKLHARSWRRTARREPTAPPLTLFWLPSERFARRKERLRAKPACFARRSSACAVRSSQQQRSRARCCSSATSRKKGHTVCRTLSRVASLSLLCGAERPQAQQALQPCKGAQSTPVGDRSEPKRARRANEPMVQVAQVCVSRTLSGPKHPLLARSAARRDARRSA